MKFSEEQNKALAAPLKSSVVMQRSQSGLKLSYIEGWHAIAEANRIFGFDGWWRETVDIRIVSEKPRKVGSQGAEGWGVTYVCRVRVTVGDGESCVIREGCGTGHGIDRDLGQAHESAVKEAETDAMKRALMTFGNQFGLALYDKTQANVTDEEDEPAAQGEYPLMIPGDERPYTRVTTQEVWVMEFNDMAARIRNSTKHTEDQKTDKLNQLQTVNQHIIESLPEELRNGLSV